MVNRDPVTGRFMKARRTQKKAAMCKAAKTTKKATKTTTKAKAVTKPAKKTTKKAKKA